jgi:hypothetical protein
MIEYIENTTIKVKLDGKICGNIKKSSKGYQYFPKGSKIGGKIYSNLTEIKNILEGK